MSQEPLEPTLPPASERQGQPGHDTATERAVAIRLLTLRTQGLTYAQIAEETGYADASGARQALMRALNRHEAESAAELRQLENLRLDADERALRAIIGDATRSPGVRVAAINARVRLSARRARMNGLDAPVAVQISAGVAAGLDAALREMEDVVNEVTMQRPLALPGPEDEALEA